MLSSRQILFAFATAALASAGDQTMGPHFSLGPVKEHSYIRESTSTLVLPKIPTGSSGDIALWVGMGTSKGDLIQSIAHHSGGQYWSIFAYTLVQAGKPAQKVVNGKPDQAQEAAQVTMHYKFDDATHNYTQFVSVNGQQVSTLSTDSGIALGWGTAVECPAKNCGTIGAHKWINTKITLDKADRDFDQTLFKGAGVTGEMSTTDDGLTWIFTDIKIPEFTFPSH